jgi:geranylgeranyl diphosphate synthase type II
MSYDVELVNRILKQAREDVLAELTRILEVRHQTGYGPLYDLVADYPFREGKFIRPALVFAACRAASGRTEQALLSATALELFHNAALTFDDVEDDSYYRRGKVTISEAKGESVAINVGVATNVLCLGALLGNTHVVGVRKALLILSEVERMSRESAEGQAIELGWIADSRFDLTDRDYMRMAYKKTCWYTVIAPLRIGVICGSQNGPLAPVEDELTQLIELGFLAGIAFQTADDLLNLEADENVYGKESSGDLWEGKRTVMLLHFLRTAGNSDRERALKVLRTPRRQKSKSDVSWLLDAMIKAGSLKHGRALATEYSERALEVDQRGLPFLGDGEDRRFLREMLCYVIDRVK